MTFLVAVALLTLQGQSRDDQQRMTLSSDGSYNQVIYATFWGPTHPPFPAWPAVHSDVAVDLAGNVYVSQPPQNELWRIAAGGGTTRIPTDPTQIIEGIAVPPSGAYIYLAVQSNGIVRLDVATGVSASIVACCSIYATGVAIHPTTGDLYVSDANSSTIRSLPAGGGPMTVVAGNGTAGYGGDGGPATSAMLRQPGRFTLDGTGNLYVADADNSRVRKVDSVTGIITTIAGNGSPGLWGDGGPAVAARLFWPQGLRVDPAGNLYIADYSNCRVRRVDAASGVIDTFAGGATCAWNGDGGPPVGAWLARVSGLTLDTSGNVYVTEEDTNIFRVREVRVRSDDVPLAGDLDGDHKAELVVWRPGTGVWSWVSSANGYDSASAQTRWWAAGAPGDVPLLADMDGDGVMDLVLWQRSTGTWSWVTSSSNFDTSAVTSKVFGSATGNDVPIPGDIDGDGKADLVVWRGTTGTWRWLLSSAAFAPSSLGSKQWGQALYGDIPLLADFDGDRRMDLTVWRADTGTWYWLTSSTGYTYAAGRSLQWGSRYWLDEPLVADFDGDGKSDPLLMRRMTAQWFWLTSTRGYDYSYAQGRTWGVLRSGGFATEISIAADVDGDGIADLVRWRPETGTWYWLTSSSGHLYSSEGTKQWGSTR